MPVADRQRRVERLGTAVGVEAEGPTRPNGDASPGAVAAVSRHASSPSGPRGAALLKA